MNYMFELDKPTWAMMQTIKINAYQTGEMQLALYWQNEQLSKKLSDIIFALKEQNV